MRVFFHFLNHLADHPLFLNKVGASYVMRVSRVPMFRLTQKLKAVKSIIKLLNRSRGHVLDRVMDLLTKLVKVQQDILVNLQDLELS